MERIFELELFGHICRIHSPATSDAVSACDKALLISCPETYYSDSIRAFQGILLSVPWAVKDILDTKLLHC